MCSASSRCASTAIRTRCGSGSSRRAPAPAIPAGARASTARCRSARAVRCGSNFVTARRRSIRTRSTGRMSQARARGLPNAARPPLAHMWAADGPAAASEPAPARRRACQQLPGAFEVRAIVHHPVDADGPLARIAIEGGHDGARLGEGCRSRREHFVDDRDLCRMDRHLAGKAVAARFLGFAAQRRDVSKVDCDGIDRLHLRRCGARKTKRARQPIGVEEAASAIAVRFCA